MSARQSRTRVLLVDDDAAFGSVAAEHLERADDRFAVETATRVREGLERLAAGGVDCVVSDYEMPERDGLEFLEAVRAEYPDLPFILFTGKGSEEIASEAISAGVTDYLQKGTDTEQYAILANRIGNAVERTRAERDRRRSDRRFAAILDDPELLVGVLTPAGRLREVNGTALEFVAGDREDQVGRPFWETSWWGDDVDPETVRAWVERAAGGEYVEYAADLTGSDGEPYAVRGEMRPVRDDRGDVVSIVVSARDVTARRRTERQRRRLRAAIDAVDAGVLVLDGDGTVTYADGDAPSGLRDASVDEFDAVAGVDDAVAAEHRVAIERVLAGETESVALDAAFAGDAPDAETRYVAVTAEDGSVVGAVGVVGGGPGAETERLGRFARVVSHDLRNPLATARGYLRLAREEGDAEYFRRVESTLDRMDRLVEDVLWLAREGRDIGHTEPVDLGAAAEASWTVVAGDRSGATLDVDESVGCVEADEDRLRQLLENLFGNALEHASSENGPEPESPHGRGAVDVTVRVERCEDGFAVVDDGPGIPESLREQVFERGFSTAESGNGMGLAIVSGIASAHGWEIRIADAAGGGTRFEVTGVERPADHASQA